ncbi:hypothetical protein HJFPF1_00036 [Paramyrothecium foliicola]|nr:hypothetical protein HJFPF1_00036 [Paramyrothecium foliicola]
MGLFFLDMTIDGRGRRAFAFTSVFNKSVITSRKERLADCTGVLMSHVELNDQGTEARLVHIKSTKPPLGHKRDAWVKVKRA